MNVINKINDNKIGSINGIDRAGSIGLVTSVCGAKAITGAHRIGSINRDKALKLAEEACLIFFSGAVLGWIYEVLLYVFEDGIFVNRGMLHGPWLPIYGVGCVLFAGLKSKIGNHPFRFFVISALGSAVLEYITSWLMEAVYHARWWDYSDMPLNLNGRIYIWGLVFFGLAGCAFSYLLLPVLEKLSSKIPVQKKRVIALAVIFAFAVDVIISLAFPNAGPGITG